MPRTDDIHSLPPNLPVPVDDGACGQLEGSPIPPIRFRSTSGGAIDLSTERGRIVVYVYPRTGRPDQDLPAGWNEIPGARGCTPQSCGFRDHAAALAARGARVAGLSVQSLHEQLELAERLHIPYPVIADPERKLGAALRLPTFDFEGLTLYKRVTLVLEQGRIAKVFYPVFPPDRHAGEVVAWLEARQD